MTITLRPYQERMVGETYQHIRDGINRILLVAVMGSGKTVKSSWIMRDAVSRGKRVLFLVPLTTLIDQTVEKLELLGVHASALQGDREYNRAAPVTVASIQTISARLRRGQTFTDLLGHQDLLFADEAHKTAFDQTFETLERYVLGQGGLSLGLTATPWRLSKKEWLGQKYDQVVIGPQPPEMVKLGAVVPCRGFTLDGVLDRDELRTAAGDFTLDSISQQATRSDALQLVVREWQRLAGDRPTIMVGATVGQARLTAQAFEEAGIKTASIFGDTPLGTPGEEKYLDDGEGADRQTIFAQVARGEVQIICSVGCLTAGFDLPCISAVVYVRATKSRSLFLQTAGRGSRPSPETRKEDFLLLDFGGNLRKFGNPMGYQDYDISQPPKRGGGEPPYKQCPECSAEVLSFAKICPECQFEFLGDDSKVIQIDDSKKLSEFGDDQTQTKYQTIRRLRRGQWKRWQREGKASPDQPVDTFIQKFGHPPPAEYMRHACLGTRASKAQKEEFVGWISQSYRGKEHFRTNYLAHHIHLEFGHPDIHRTSFRWWEVLGVPEPEADLLVGYTAKSWSEIQQQYLQKLGQLDEKSTEAGLDLAAALEQAREAIEQPEQMEVSA